MILYLYVYFLIKYVILLLNLLNKIERRQIILNGLNELKTGNLDKYFEVTIHSGK